MITHLVPVGVESLWSVAGWTMLHYLWVGAGIGLLAGVGRWLLQAAGPNVRYVFALLSLAVLAAAPVGIAWRVATRMPIAGASTDRHAAVPLPTFEQRVDTLALAEALDPHSGVARAAVSTSPPESATTTVGLARAEAGAPFQEPDGQTERLLSFAAVVAGWLPWLWLVGTPAMFALLAMGLLGAGRLRRRSDRLDDGDLVARCRRLAARLRVARQVTVGVCDRLVAPVLVGIVKPMILLPPAALTGWSTAQLEMVLLHELAHVRRWDNLVNFLQRIVESLLFFQPAVWIVNGWVRREREYCCDALVVAHTGQPRIYAETLAALARARSIHAGTRPAVIADGRGAVSAMARGFLVARIRHVLKREREPMQVSRKLIVVMAVAAVAVAVVVWCGPSTGQADGLGLAAPEKALAQTPDQREGATVANEQDDTRSTMDAEERSDKAEQDEPSGDRADKAVETAAVSDRQGIVSQQAQQALATLREIDVRKAELQLERARAIYERTAEAGKKEARLVPPRVLQDRRLALERAVLGVARAKAEAVLRAPANDAAAKQARDTLRELKVREVELSLDNARRRYEELVQRGDKSARASEALLIAKQGMERAALDVESTKAKAVLNRLHDEGVVIQGIAAARTPADPPVRKDALRYDDKTFDDWRRGWRTELKPARRTEAIQAFKTFAAHGYAHEAARAIVDVMRHYDTFTIDSSPEGKLKRAAIDSFKSIDSADALDTLIEELRSDNAKGRLFSIRALQTYGHNAQPALPALLQAIDDDDWRVRALAMGAVRAIDPSAEGFLPALRTAVKDDNANVVKAAITALVPSSRVGEGYSGDRGDMRRRLAQLRRGFFQRGRFLGPLPGAYVPELGEAIRHADPGVRLQAIMALMALGSRAKDAVPALIDELRVGGHPNELWAVVETLGSIGSEAKEAVPVLQTIIIETSDIGLRDVAERVLDIITSPSGDASE